MLSWRASWPHGVARRLAVDDVARGALLLLGLLLLRRHAGWLRNSAGAAGRDPAAPEEIAEGELAFSEKRFESKRLGLVARLDRAYRKGGELHLVELKTRGYFAAQRLGCGQLIGSTSGPAGGDRRTSVICGLRSNSMAKDNLGRSRLACSVDEVLAYAAGLRELGMALATRHRRQRAGRRATSAGIEPCQRLQTGE